ncbi:MAG: hypothetical protein EXS30_09160 [Pedosphaera sp.]|nr:hypothetical protein [Pedosphaera sp.]
MRAKMRITPHPFWCRQGSQNDSGLDPALSAKALTSPPDLQFFRMNRVTTCPNVGSKIMKTRISFRWFAFAALGVCLLTPVSFAQVLQNGVWANANASAPQIPTFQVPAGQASLRFEVQSVRAYDLVNNLPAISSLILAAAINSNPSRDSAPYRASFGAGSSGTLNIANPPPGLYWFRLFPTEFSIRYLGDYQVRATYFPPPPTITSQPQAQTVKAGASASFSVAATSSATLTYQWQKNGANIGGATGSTYTISNAQPTDEANFACVVSNSGGPVTSSAAKLTVLVPPTITSQPKSVAVMPGNNATFEVAATGTAPLTYAWMKNGSPVSGATANTFTISNVTFSDAASYTVEVRNSAGSVTSAAALLTIGPSITVQPQSVTVSAGGSATFGVTATGSAPLSYQWYRNSSALGGQVNTTFSLSNVQSADTGSIYVKVSNAAGSVQSSTVSLTVISTPPPPPPDAKPTITAQPQSLTATEGGTATLTVVATGTAPFIYQWYFTPSAGVGVQSLGATGAKAVAGGTSATLQLSPVTAAQAGDYYAVVSNGVGSATSTIARLTADPKPQVVTQPQSREVPPGTNVTFTVAAIGRAPLSYQWYRDDQLIPGATQSSMTLNNVVEADSGKSIAVLVSNASGSVRTQFALLTVSAAFADVGTLLWSSDTPSLAAPAFRPDGSLYLSTTTNQLFAVSPTGQILWSVPNAGWLGPIGRDGRIYTVNNIETNELRSGIFNNAVIKSVWTEINAFQNTGRLSRALTNAVLFSVSGLAMRSDGQLVSSSISVPSSSGNSIIFTLRSPNLLNGDEGPTSGRWSDFYNYACSVMIGEDNSLYAQGGSTLHARNPDGSMYWD